MALDRGGLPRVAWLLLAVAGCAPTVFAPAPPPEPTPTAKLQRPRPAATGGRQIVVGEMCPQSAAGRPAVAPLIMHAVQWIDNATEINTVVERGSTPRFAVFDLDGKVAGVFDTVGIADVGVGQSVAAGAYTGASPCSSEVSKGQRTDNPACVAATSSCGLAVAELAQPDDPVQTPDFKVSGACIDGDMLAVDIDGDGVTESFPLAQVLDGIRGPATEWAAAPIAPAKCERKFSLFDIPLAAEAEPGKPVNPKRMVTMDVLGVLDLDGDGRKDLVLGLRFPTVRSIVIYSTSGSAQRLELVGEAPSFVR